MIVPKSYTPAQKFALEGLYNQSRELKSHGGAKGALLKLQSAYPHQFFDQTEARVQQWFKTRRKHQNRRQRLQELPDELAEHAGRLCPLLQPAHSADAAPQSVSQDTSEEEHPEGTADAEDLSNSRLANGQTEQADISADIQQSQGQWLAREDVQAAVSLSAAYPGTEGTLNPNSFPEGSMHGAVLSDRAARQKKYTTDYKLRQSLYKQIDRYCARAGGQTEVALCISSATQRDSIWVHGRGLAMSSAGRRDVLGTTFRGLISQKRENSEQGVQSEREEEGGGGVRQGNYKRRILRYQDFAKASECQIQEELTARGQSAGPAVVPELCAKIWQQLTLDEKRLLQSGTTIRAMLAQRPNLWDKGIANTQAMRQF